MNVMKQARQAAQPWYKNANTNRPVRVTKALAKRSAGALKAAATRSGQGFGQPYPEWCNK
jgi:hypothetical protein